MISNYIFFSFVFLCCSIDEIGSQLLGKDAGGVDFNARPPVQAKLRRGDQLHIGDDANSVNANDKRPDQFQEKPGPGQGDHLSHDSNLGAAPPAPINDHAAPRVPPVNQDSRDGNHPKPIIVNGPRYPAQSTAGDHLADRPQCAQDIAKYCGTIPRQNDIAVLQCLQDVGETDDSLPEPCQHLLWEFKANLTQDDRFRKTAEDICKDDLKNSGCDKITNERGHLISCLSDFKDQMSDSHCKAFMTRMETIVFTDFRLVGPFVTACREDVRKFSCGQLEDERNKAIAEPSRPGPPGQPGQAVPPQPPPNRTPHSQGATLDCLIRKLIDTGKGEKDLSPVCRHEIIRIAELQAEDFHLDRPLFFACREDREKFCSGIAAGEGRVFQCLADRRYDSDMSQQCRSTLDVRLQLMSRDYKISRQLVKGCQHEMKQFNCDFSPDPKLPPPPEHTYLSYLILCLEDAARRETSRFSPQCQNQLFEHRRLLMSDYRMNPELVLTCSLDISRLCADKLEDGGRTLHCLMSHVRRPNSNMDNSCRQALIKTMTAGDVGQDYRVDRVLYADCRQLIDLVCQKEATSPSDVLSCLMMNVESKYMTEDCEDRLLEVQYFLARDYKLDPQLYHACQQDAAEKCGDSGPWADANKPVVPPPPIEQQQQQQGQNKKLEPGVERGYLVMTCLYRHLYDDDDQNKLAPKCAKEVQRVMHERSISVNLLPQIEDACIPDLAEKCQKTGHGEELRCLQDQLKDLSDLCKKAVQEFTEQEAMDTRLDQAIMRACGPVLEQHCKDSLDKVMDKGEILHCLVTNKGVPAMNNKCRTIVNHYELVSLKDYRFTYKFRQACKADIERHCLQNGAASDKATVVSCLSEIVVKHALLSGQEQLSKECRKQLRVEYFLLESADTKIGDPKLLDMCGSDYKRFCDKAENTAQLFECLRERKSELEPRCRKYVFKKEKLEFQDNTFDVTLNRVCADEIRTLCAHEQPEHVFHCLKTKIDRDGVQKSFDCLELIKKRKHEQATDIRLQPTLARACSGELQTVCKGVMDDLQKRPEEEAEGVVISCLRQLVTSHQKGVSISAGCQVEVRRIIYESEVDPSLDPPFYRKCKDEIMSKCSQQLMLKEDHPSLLECMKVNYKKNLITRQSCKEELARKINEELADIHLDPELNTACATDLQHYCDDVKAGDAKLLKCLLDASKSTNVRLTQACHAKLLDRRALWDHVKSDKLQLNLPGDVGAVVQALYVSPVRNTLATMLLIIVFVIFAFGLCCGRVTRRVRRDMKNR